ncbi:Uncharacterised protein r2_g3170 [Pycnogonum litorale]
MRLHLSFLYLLSVLIEKSSEQYNSRSFKRIKEKVSTSSQQCPVSCSCSNKITDYSAHETDDLPKMMRTVNCTNKKWKSIPSRIPSKTQSLLLANNRIRDVHYLLPDLIELIYLDLTGNKIRNIGRGLIFRRLKKLRVLYLSNNAFRILFNNVFKTLSSLKELHICRTRLSYIDQFAFDGLHRLTHLHLRGNHLESIFPEWFGSLDELRVLDLSENRISYVSSRTFVHLSRLEILDVRSNAVKGLSETALGGLFELRRLHLDSNRLADVPSEPIKALIRLKELDLSNNPIDIIRPNDFSNSTLEVLVLDNMPKLRLVKSRSLSFLPRLSVVRMNFNRRLKFVDPDALRYVNENLRSLEIVGSDMPVLLPELARSFSSATKINVSETPLLCDCNVKWMLLDDESDPQNRSAIVNKHRLRCSSPRLLKNVRLEDLNSSMIPDTCSPIAMILSDPIMTKTVRERITLECRAIGLPRPEISWITPTGRKLTRNGRSRRISVTDQGSLDIKYTRLIHDGQYTCSARNSNGIYNATVALEVIPIDLHIFINRISATFVTVVWNGTARGSYDVYKLLYREITSSSGSELQSFISIVITPFDRYYTISNLRPRHAYGMCIAVEDGVPPEMLEEQIVSCINVTTLDHRAFLNSMARGTSNIAVGIALGISVLTVIVLWFVYLAAKKYRYRKYQDPETDEMEKYRGSATQQIQLETLYSPLISQIGQR